MKDKSEQVQSQNICLSGDREISQGESQEEATIHVIDFRSLATWREWSLIDRSGLRQLTRGWKVGIGTGRLLYRQFTEMLNK
jgi:hypothetical protein